MTAYVPREYWTAVAKHHAATDETGIAPVMHPDAPLWFNRLIDAIQFRSIRRALSLANVARGARILDVGCGTGRWVRRYEQLGFQATGVDATLPMLTLARKRTAGPLVLGDASRLPFSPETFDCVSDVTVVQHIPTAQQQQVIGELARVLAPGGTMIWMELIRGEGAHIFPRKPDGWIEQAVVSGLTPIAWFPEEYLMIDRLFVRAARSIAGRRKSEHDIQSPAEPAAQWRRSWLHSAYWGIRHITIPISAWTEVLAEGIVPARLATHGVFVFRK